MPMIKKTFNFCFKFQFFFLLCEMFCCSLSYQKHLEDEEQINIFYLINLVFHYIFYGLSVADTLKGFLLPTVEKR